MCLHSAILIWQDVAYFQRARTIEGDMQYRPLDEVEHLISGLVAPILGCFRGYWTDTHPLAPVTKLVAAMQSDNGKRFVPLVEEGTPSATATEEQPDVEQAVTCSVSYAEAGENGGGSKAKKNLFGGRASFSVSSRVPGFRSKRAPKPEGSSPPQPPQQRENTRGRFTQQYQAALADSAAVPNGFSTHSANSFISTNCSTHSASSFLSADSGEAAECDGAAAPFAPSAALQPDMSA